MIHHHTPETEQIAFGENIGKPRRISLELPPFSDLLREKDILLETSTYASGIRNKHSLLSLFTSILKKYVPFNGIALYLLDHPRSHAVCYLAYSDSTDILPQATALADDINLRPRKEAILTEVLSAPQSIASRGPISHHCTPTSKPSTKSIASTS